MAALTAILTSCNSLFGVDELSFADGGATTTIPAAASAGGAGGAGGNDAAVGGQGPMGGGTTGGGGGAPDLCEEQEPALCMRFDDNLLDEGSSGATFSGAPSYARGVRGQALIPNPTAPARSAPLSLVGSALTVELWARIDPGPITGQHVLLSYDGEWSIELNDEGFVLIVAGLTAFEMLPFFIDGNWHHYAVTGTATQIDFYVDGIPAAGPNTPIVPPMTATELTIGDGPSGGKPWPGAVDELRIWTKLLDATTIASHALRP